MARTVSAVSSLHTSRYSLRSCEVSKIELLSLRQRNLYLLETRLCVNANCRLSAAL